MASQLELPLSTKSKSEGSSTPRTSQPERRSSRRCKITQLMHVRPSDPERDQFDDIRGSVSVSRSGVFFHSSEVGYEIGMRLFVTMPYTREPGTMSHEYLAEVVRRDLMPNGLYGVGFKILMQMGIKDGFGASGPPRK
jgi:hypothetical protein